MRKQGGESSDDRVECMSCRIIRIPSPVQGSAEDMNQILHASTPRAPMQDLGSPGVARIGRPCRGLEPAIDITSTRIAFEWTQFVCGVCPRWLMSTCHSDSAQEGRPWPPGRWFRSRRAGGLRLNSYVMTQLRHMRVVSTIQVYQQTRT